MSRTRTTLAALAACSLALAACGGNDDAAESPPETVAAPAVPAAEGSDGMPDIQVAPGDDPVDAITDAMGEDGEAIDDALAAIPAESRFDVVASQLDPKPTVEVDGSDIRLVFDGSSIDNATFDCIVAGSFVEPGETLTLVYPDGEQEC
jgi:hypothetical protein